MRTHHQKNPVFILLLLLGTAAADLAAGQQPAPAPQAPPAAAAPAPEYKLTPFVRNWTRVESWSYFEPRPGGGDPDYTFIANRLLAGLRHTGPRHEVTASVQYVQFGNLPDDAIGPGQLGTGAAYYDHNRRTDSRQVYLKSANVLLKQIVPRLDVRLGRMPYTSGAEVASGNAGLEAVKRLRLDSRLVGEFEWSLYQRAFDGGRIDYDDRRSLHATFAAFWPTHGGFDEKANRNLENVRIVGGVIDARPSGRLRHTQAQAFAWNYRDTRPVTGRPDNSGRRVGAADIDVNTFGGSLVGAYPAAGGRVDALAWIAWQNGDWYESSQGAYAFAFEAGYHWPGAAWRPWIRGGWNRASGDDDPADDEHGTFFPLMPTARKYSLSATYTFMNLDDLFAQVILRPRADVSIRADVHRLRLADPADLWYAGSGATRRTGAIFGYAGRRSNGSQSFGVAYEGSIDWTISPHWSVNGYLGAIRGGEVVTGTFGGRNLTFAYVEQVIQF